MLIILNPGDEGNFTGQWLVTDRGDYYRWLNGVARSYEYDAYTTRQLAEESCERGK